MKSKLSKISTFLVAAGCASVYPACLAQIPEKSTQDPVRASSAEYASTEAADDGPNGAAAAAPAPAPPVVKTEVMPTAAVAGTDIRPALAKELEAMKQRIAELEAELAASGATATDAATALQGAKQNFVEAPALQAPSPAATLAQPAPAVAIPDLPAEVTTKRSVRLCRLDMA
jgi:hypothetical protein